MPDRSKRPDVNTEAPDYAYAIGRVRALENAFLTRQSWLSMLQAGYDDAKNILIGTGYGSGCDSRKIDDMIAYETDKAVQDVIEITRDRELIELFLLQEDAHNLNVLIKCARTGQDPTPMISYGGAFDPELVAACVRNGSYSELGDAFEEELSKLTDDSEPREISSSIDRAVYSHIDRVLAKKKQSVLREYFSLKADAANALSKSRSQALGWSDEKLDGMLVPGGTGAILANPRDFTDFERQLNHRTFQLLADRRFDSLDVVPIAYFLVRKQAEARSLRLLFRAKSVGMELSEHEIIPEGVM